MRSASCTLVYAAPTAPRDRLPMAPRARRPIAYATASPAIAPAVTASSSSGRRQGCATATAPAVMTTASDGMIGRNPSTATTSTTMRYSQPEVVIR